MAHPNSGASFGRRSLESQPHVPFRRLGLRLRTAFPAVLQWQQGVSRCTVIELSTTGCVLSRTPALPIGTRGLLLLRPQNLLEPFVLRCRVIRPVPRGHAVELVGVNDVQRLKLAEALDELSAISETVPDSEEHLEAYVAPEREARATPRAPPPLPDRNVPIPLARRSEPVIPLLRRPLASIARGAGGLGSRRTGMDPRHIVRAIRSITRGSGR